MSSTPPNPEPQNLKQTALRLLPIVHSEAHRLHARLPASVELDDLIGAGQLALLSAVARFDPGAGATIETYVTRRVRGALIDELRAADWAPRRVRASGQAPAVYSLSRTFETVCETGDREGVGEYGVEHVDPGAVDPASLAELRDQVDWVWRRLLPRERQVLALYFAGVYLQDIARSLRVSKGRVVQIKQRAIRRLRGLADPIGPDRKLRVAP